MTTKLEADGARPWLDAVMHCATARELLSALAGHNEHWEGDPTSWIYRGHADTAWVLQPSAVRPDHEWKAFGLHGDPMKWTERRQMNEELLARFRRGLDQSGIVVPSVSPPVTAEEAGFTTGGDNPHQDAFPLMALAKHHGLPSMLLDWSRQAAVGAYFAAAEAVRKNEAEFKDPNLAVWALQIGRHFASPHAMLWRKSGHLRLYGAPGGTNPNLRAQSGLFTILWGEHNPDFETYLATEKEADREVPRLRQFTMPRTEARQLLRLLAYQGITAATMFPGVDAIVRAMREEALWDKSPRGERST